MTFEHWRSTDNKGPATRNDIVEDPSATMDFNVAKIASARASSTISSTISLRVAGPEVTNYQTDHQLVRPNRCKIKPVPNTNIYTKHRQ